VTAPVPAEGAVQETVTESLSLLLLWVTALCNDMIKFHSFHSFHLLFYIISGGHVCVMENPNMSTFCCRLTVNLFLRTLGVLHELSLATPPGEGVTKAPTPGESSAASLLWMKNPLKVGLLPTAERVTVWRIRGQDVVLIHLREIIGMQNQERNALCNFMTEMHVLHPFILNQ